MKKFIYKITPYLLGLIVLHLFWARYADGNTDSNYRRFLGQNPSSLILGDSRGAQGVIPEELLKKLKDQKFFNFAFNIVHSPYGLVYLDAIKKRLDTTVKDGIFILTVNPWNVATSKMSDGIEYFPEDELSPLSNMTIYDAKINYEYLLKDYNNSWYFIYRDSEVHGLKSNTYLHQDGWLEVNVDMNADEVKKRAEVKVSEYKEYAKTKSISRVRLKYLEETIAFLQKYGKVYMVRLPTSEEITRIEKEAYPTIDKTFEGIAKKYGINYFNFSNESNNYQYTDGNHLYKESSRKISDKIADSILIYHNK